MRDHLNRIENVTLWEINCTICSIAVSCKELNDDVTTTEKRKNEPPKWITSIENSINRIRKLIAHIQVVIKCKKECQFTKHQKTLLQMLKKKFGNSKMSTLETKLALLKKELKSKADNLRHQKCGIERKRINKQLLHNPKKVYRKMKDDKIEIEKVPTKENVEQFWKSIWQDSSIFNEKVEWLKVLEDTYCKNVVDAEYKIERVTLEKLIKKIQISKVPGQDRIIGYWFKNLSSYRDVLAIRFNELPHSNTNKSIPTWFSTAHTILIPKNKLTDSAKNYTPIACLNVMYKLYTSCLNSFITDHVYRNNIITQGQAAGKRGIWGTLEQRLIYKNIMKEVRKMRRNLITVWLDYRKAFDSIPHSWLIKLLKLAKIPNNIISAIENLAESWYTILHLNGNNETIVSDLIKIIKGIYQGDSLSVMLFVLALNPLSHFLRMRNGYPYGKNRHYQHTHNFFVYDLKLFSTNMNNIKGLLDIVTIYSRDIGMKFGVDKCAFVQVEKGKLVQNPDPLRVNDLVIEPVPAGDTYTYLGIDENIAYDGPLNKAKLTIKKIWSELSDYNKVVAHNNFATPIIIPTVGIIDWTIDDIEQLDIKTRKKLSMTGNLHPNSDINYFYVSRCNGGRGIKQIRTLYESRIIAVRQLLLRNKDRNNLIRYIVKSEEDTMRVGKELLDLQRIADNISKQPKAISKNFNKS